MEQQTLTAGDTLNFATTVTGLAASDGWTLHYRLVPQFSGPVIELSSVADGAAHRVQVPAATTAGWRAGVYAWNSWVTKAAERYSCQTGTVTILPDPAQATAPAISSSSSTEQTALDNAIAVLTAIQQGGTEIRIGDRVVKLPTLAEAEDSVRYWQAQVQRKAAGITARGPRIFGVNLR